MMSMKDASYFLKLFSRGRYVTTRSIARNEAGSGDRERQGAERQRKHAKEHGARGHENGPQPGSGSLSQGLGATGH